MQCREALVASNGDMAKALELLKRKSADIAAKKSTRTLGSGVIVAYVHGGSIGALVKLLCETDFVARNPDFKILAEDIAMHVSAMNPEYVSEKDVPADKLESLKAEFMKEVASMDKPEEIKAKIVEGKVASYVKERTLLEQPFVKDQDKTVGQVVKEGIQKFGENIEVGGFEALSVR